MNRLASLLRLVLLAPGAVLAADVTCGIGTRVVGEMGGGQTGEIAEIGREAPYVGAYRIVFGWNAPKGDWYNPGTWDIHPEGTDDRCVVGADSTAAPAQAAQQAVAPTAAAAAPPPVTSSEQCPAGRAVVDRQQLRGKVLGENNGMCVVRLADGSTRSYLAWMLEDAGAAPAATQGLPAGTYDCSASAAGTFPVELLDEGTYRDRAGTRGRYALAEDGVLTFDSGSLAGHHARVLGAGKFGLSAQPTSVFYTVCNRRRG